MVVTKLPNNEPSGQYSEQQSLLSEQKAVTQIITTSSPLLVPNNTHQQYQEQQYLPSSEAHINPNYDAATVGSPFMNGGGQQLPATSLQTREQSLDPGYSSKLVNTSFSDCCCSSGASLALVLFIIVASISQIICEIVVYPNNLENTLVQILPRVLVYLPLGLAIIYYIILVFVCSTAKYLFNNDNASNIYDNVDKLTRARPTISLYVSCYHYETRYERYTDSEGNTKTRTYTETVTTYSETRSFNYNYFRDVSKPFLLEGTDKKYMKLKLNQVTFISNGETKAALDEARRRIQVENRWRDDYMSYNERWSLDTTFKTNMLAKIKPEESSFFVSMSCYLLMSLVGLNSVYRFIFNRMCDTQEHMFVKEISVTPFPEQVAIAQQPIYNAGYSSVYGQGTLQSVYGLNQTEYQPPRLVLPNPQQQGPYQQPYDYVPYQQQVYQ